MLAALMRKSSFLWLSIAAGCTTAEVETVRVTYLDDDTPVDYIHLEIGDAKEIEVTIAFKGKYYHTGEYFRLSGDDKGSFGLAPMANSDAYLIWGQSQGTSCLLVEIADADDVCINVIVGDDSEYGDEKSNIN